MMPIVATTLSSRQWDDWEQEYYLKSKSKSELGMEGHWPQTTAAPRPLTASSSSTAGSPEASATARTTASECCSSAAGYPYDPTLNGEEPDTPRPSRWCRTPDPHAAPPPPGPARLGRRAWSRACSSSAAVCRPPRGDRSPRTSGSTTRLGSSSGRTKKPPLTTCVVREGLVESREPNGEARWCLFDCEPGFSSRSIRRGYPLVTLNYIIAAVIGEGECATFFLKRRSESQELRES